MIRVMVVDDAPVARKVLQRMLTQTGEIQVTAMASNGAQALEMLDKARPHVILTDLNMPVMNGLEFVQQLMRLRPTPVLVVSAAVDRGPSDENTFKLLAAGAIDVIPKPRGGLDETDRKTSASLISKIKILKGVIPIPRHLGSGQWADKTDELTRDGIFLKQAPKIVAMGASTGGPVTIRSILYRLPPDFPLPVVCIQHISRGFSGEMVAWLKTQIRMDVKTAENKTSPRPGTVYFPPENQHLTFDANGRFTTSAGSATDLHRPSVDMAFFRRGRHLWQAFGGHSADRHGKGRGRGTGRHPRQGRPHHRPGPGLLRGVRHARRSRPHGGGG